MIKLSTRVIRRTPVICRAKPSHNREIEGTRALCIASAIALVSASLVFITTAREFNLDLEKSQQEYTRLQDVSRQLTTLKEKQLEDEIMLNALIEEILKLRHIGII
jgi:hypothetical protein